MGIKLNQMLATYMRKLFHPINIIGLIMFFSFITCGSGVIQGSKALNVGEELFKETLSLCMGSCYYQLKGLKPYMWYEVKISYPASIPAIFSLQLKRGNSDVGMNRLRKLLNTEKLVFKTENIDDINSQGGMYVLVTVEPEGVVAIPGVQERDSILFNIVCDELVLGIPHKAWLVVIFALLCLVIGFLMPRFLPPFLLPKDEDKSVSHMDKNS